MINSRRSTNLVFSSYLYVCAYVVLSSTLPEIDPDTAYVVCISVSLGFRQKPSDTALLSVIALTTFNCIVSASATKEALVCLVVTVHWWRHRTHHDVTEAYRALRNIPTVHLNNGAICADLRGILKHCEVTAKAGRQSIYMGDFDAIFFITRYRINPYSYSVFFMGQVAVHGNRRSGLRPSGFTWQVTSARLAGDVIQVWKNSSSSNHCISHFKAQLAQLFWFNILYVYVLDKRNTLWLRDTVRLVYSTVYILSWQLPCQMQKCYDRLRWNRNILYNKNTLPDICHTMVTKI